MLQSRRHGDLVASSSRDPGWEGAWRKHSEVLADADGRGKAVIVGKRAKKRTTYACRLYVPATRATMRSAKASPAVSKPITYVVEAKRARGKLAATKPFEITDDSKDRTPGA